MGAEGFEPPSTGLEPVIIPSYTIPPDVGAKSVLGLSACTLSASQLLLAPLPPLVAGFFPSTGTSLHGERLGDLPSVYERIGPRRRVVGAGADGSRPSSLSLPCDREGARRGSRPQGMVRPAGRAEPRLVGPPLAPSCALAAIWREVGHGQTTHKPFFEWPCFSVKTVVCCTAGPCRACGSCPR